MLLQLLTHPQLLSDSRFLLSLLVEICYFIPAMIVALTLHECAHAYVAFRCGDPTAKMLGRMSLNPGAHLDLRGSLCLLLFGSFLLSGENTTTVSYLIALVFALIPAAIVNAVLVGQMKPVAQEKRAAASAAAGLKR